MAAGHIEYSNHVFSLSCCIIFVLHFVQIDRSFVRYELYVLIAISTATTSKHILLYDIIAWNGHHLGLVLLLYNRNEI